MTQRELFIKAVAQIGDLEESLRRRGVQTIIGVDEAGRGPLAGPVHAGAFWLDLGRPLSEQLAELNDSKALKESAREELFERIQSSEYLFALGVSDARRIDEINILAATFEAMTQAVEKLIASAGCAPDLILIDGNMILPDCDHPQQAIIKGDAKSLAIAAASILAKVSRDRFMRQAHERWPQYGFDTNKGYGTPAHRRALKERGPCALHRLSFAGVLQDDRILPSS